MNQSADAYGTIDFSASMPVNYQNSMLSPPVSKGIEPSDTTNTMCNTAKKLKSTSKKQPGTM